MTSEFGISVVGKLHTIVHANNNMGLRPTRLRLDMQVDVLTHMNDCDTLYDEEEFILI